MNTAPIDSANYMIAGYALFLVLLLAYVASLVIRWRRLVREASILNNKEKNKKEKK